MAFDDARQCARCRVRRHRRASARPRDAARVGGVERCAPASRARAPRAALSTNDVMWICVWERIGESCRRCARTVLKKSMAVLLLRLVKR